MKLKIFIKKFTDRELETGDECQNFYFSRGVLYYITYGIKLYIASYSDDYVVIKWREDVKSGLKKLLRFIDKDVKLLFTTREIEFTDIDDMDHELVIINMIYYFAQGRWFDLFIKYELDIYKIIFDYVDRFDCEDELKNAVEKTTSLNPVRYKRGGYYYAFYDKKVSIGPSWDDEYGVLDHRYKDKFVYIYRQYKIYQLIGY
jgi:hypothetical protein